MYTIMVLGKRDNYKFFFIIIKIVIFQMKRIDKFYLFYANSFCYMFYQVTIFLETENYT